MEEYHKKQRKIAENKLEYCLDLIYRTEKTNPGTIDTKELEIHLIALNY